MPFTAFSYVEASFFLSSLSYNSVCCCCCCFFFFFHFVLFALVFVSFFRLLFGAHRQIKRNFQFACKLWKIDLPYTVQTMHPAIRHCILFFSLSVCVHCTQGIWHIHILPSVNIHWNLIFKQRTKHNTARRKKEVSRFRALQL